VQILEVFIYGNYLSQQDVEIAEKYPVEKLESNENYVHINVLYIKLKDLLRGYERLNILPPQRCLPRLFQIINVFIDNEFVV